jgi:hypothetical protein
MKGASKMNNSIFQPISNNSNFSFRLKYFFNAAITALDAIATWLDDVFYDRYTDDETDFSNF